MVSKGTIPSAIKLLLITFRAGADLFKWEVAFEAAAVRAAITGDDAGEATDRVAIDWVVDGAVADATIVHFTDDGFECGDVLRWVTIEFDVGDVTALQRLW